METMGLIAAMAQESDTFLRYIKGWKRVALGSFDGYSFELSGQSFLLVTSGMGSRRAAEAATTLVNLNAARILISFGIAGAVETDLQIGDVITAEAVCRLDQGITGPLVLLASWPETAREAMVQALSRRGARLWTGTAVTTGGSQAGEQLLQNTIRPILEMETAGIAQVAAEHGIPLYSLRAVSDGPSAPIPLDLAEIMDEDANPQAGKILKAIARHPLIVFKFGRLMKNTRIAADNAAIALLAALNQTTLG